MKEQEKRKKKKLKKKEKEIGQRQKKEKKKKRRRSLTCDAASVFASVPNEIKKLSRETHNPFSASPFWCTAGDHGTRPQIRKSFFFSSV